MKPSSFALTLPPSTSPTQLERQINAERSIVIVGANGSGKTKLGAWLETRTANHPVHRVSAQKSLKMPKATATKELHDAERLLLYGHPEHGAPNTKVTWRWRNDPDIEPTDDFDALMSYLFTEEFNALAKAKQSAGKDNKPVTLPTTKLDRIKSVFEAAMPHCKLLISAGKVEASPAAEPSLIYNGARMSDGERVVFYLVGEVLSALPNSIIVIDEPEIHLHKTI